MSADQARALLLQLIGSLTLAEHMGDVADDVNTVLVRLGLTDLLARQSSYENDTDDFWHALARALHDDGVTTLYGTELWSADDEEDA